MADQKIDQETANDIDLLQDVVGRALKAGADAADAVLFEGVSLSHARRLGKTEKLERSESQDLGLRVLIGKRQAIVSTSDRSPKMLAELVERTLAMARAVPEDPFCGLADPEEIARDWPALDMLDPVEPSAETPIERARAARRHGARKIATCRCPVVFDPRAARGFISHLLGAISGPSIARGTSFLRDKLGQQIFPEAITITEDPHRQRGQRSRPFDAEGIANRRRALIDKGVLTTWLLDLRSARQLGLTSTGHAARGTASPPSPSATNVWIEPGAMSPKELIADIASGFYVTEMMGMGVNGVTGDYSRGAAGFWIDKGEITFPVSEMTVAGNLKDIFARLVAADDLEFKAGADAPTLRVDDLTVAGA